MENLVSVKYNVPLLEPTVQKAIENQCFSNHLNDVDTIHLLCEKLYSLDDKNDSYIITQLRYLESLLTVLQNQPEITFGIHYEKYYWYFNQKYVSYWIKIDENWSAQRIYPLNKTSTWYSFFTQSLQEKDRDTLDTKWTIKVGHCFFKL